MSLIASDDSVLEAGLKDLQLVFGPIDFTSRRLPFNYTDYYSKEMGTDLFRHFIAFEQLIPMEVLPRIKQTTNGLEQKWSGPDGKRRINIDPGYLSLQHVVLATTKSYTHRPYLREGIYVDLTLIYRKKSFHPLEWTYPDYKEEEILSMFNQLREDYAGILRGRELDSCQIR